MSEITLFATPGENTVQRLQPRQVNLEKDLQSLVENNMQTIFGVRLVQHEWVITEGRMDSVGIDENNCPVIFEYKRGKNENVMNQGLFYLHWLVDHKADYADLVRKKFGEATADSIDWKAPCVMCIASDFTRYDVHAADQISKMSANKLTIKLIRYYRYGEDLLLFEYLNAPRGDHLPAPSVCSTAISAAPGEKPASGQKTHAEKLAAASPELLALYEAVCAEVEDLGEDVAATDLKFYRAYRRLTNLACLELHNSWVYVFLKLDPDKVALLPNMTNVRGVGHLGTGDVRVKVSSLADLKPLRPFLEGAYENA